MSKFNAIDFEKRFTEKFLEKQFKNEASSEKA